MKAKAATYSPSVSKRAFFLSGLMISAAFVMTAQNMRIGSSPDNSFSFPSASPSAQKLIGMIHHVGHELVKPKPAVSVVMPAHASVIASAIAKTIVMPPVIVAIVKPAVAKAKAVAATPVGNPLIVEKLLAAQQRLVDYAWNYDAATGSVTETPKPANVSAGKCAHAVVTAFRHAGIDVIPNNANALKPNFEKAGFVQIARPSQFKIGDVMLIAPDKNYPYGHVSTYNGHRWVSDFNQAGMWVFSGEAVNTKLYTFMRNPVVAASADAYTALQQNQFQYAAATKHEHKHYHDFRFAYNHTHYHHWKHRYAAASHKMTMPVVAASAPVAKPTVVAATANQSKTAPAPQRRQTGALLYSMRIENLAYTLG